MTAGTIARQKNQTRDEPVGRRRVIADHAMDYLESLFSLAGQTAVVTGGAGAIGTVISDTLLRAGANVAIWSRTSESIAAFQARYDEEPAICDRIAGFELDTGDEEAVARALEQTERRFALPDILVNGVGGN
ncbi:MAG: SDR family NAD(P)-dependent oxidoreductase, partial [Desulfofustis sp.]|nr:SDR family NAD(P)-dependent oxidoreductase [Desulfofustis sp.]